MKKENEPLVSGSVGEPAEIPSVCINDIHDFVAHLQGKILTIVDATINDSRNSAMKSLIKQALWDNNAKLQDWAWDQATGRHSSFPFRPSDQLPQ